MLTGVVRGLVGAMALLCALPLVAAGDMGLESPSRDADIRVVNGEVAAITDAPWQVGLLSAAVADDYTAQFCGGSIVHPEWVVTAAHCVDSASAPQVQVLTGKSSLAATAGDSGPRVNVAAIYVHPLWNAMVFSHDVAVLRLESPLTLDGVNRASIALPRSQDAMWPTAGTPALITGWGSLSFGGPYPTELHKATVDVLTGPADPMCGNYSTSEYLNSVMLCGGTVASPVKDTCQGDSGGPFAINVGGSWLLAGITSWGDGCAQEGYPGVYSRVTALTSWIDDYVPFSTPDAVTNLSAEPGDRRATVTFTAPANPGMSPVTGYEYSVAGGSWTTAGTAASPVTVSGLVNGTAVDIRLRAGNAQGPGAASAPVSVTPRTTPGPPTGLAAVPGNRLASVSFTAPADNGGSSITDYEYSIDNGGWVSAGSTSAPMTIPGLTNGSSYSLRIRAVNAAGAGTASVPVAVTLSPDPPPPAAPSVPRNVTAASGDRRITVGFTPPADDGGSPITDYQYMLNGSNWVSAATTGSPITLSGLRNGTAVKVKLRAVNAVGPGQESSSVTATPFGRPGKPGTVRGSRMGRAKVNLRWRSASSNGATVTYTVQVRRKRTWSTVAKTTRIRWTGKVPGAQHLRPLVMRVGTRNAAGSGPHSATVRIR